MKQDANHRRRSRGRYAVLRGNFWRNPKTRKLSPAARGIYADSLAYCADNATDGFVPKCLLPAFFGALPDEQVVAELVNGRFWYDRDDTFEVHDYTLENPTKADLEERARQQAEKARRRWGNPGGKPDGNASGSPGGSAPGNAGGIHNNDAGSNPGGSADAMPDGVPTQIPDPRSQIPRSQVPAAADARIARGAIAEDEPIDPVPADAWADIPNPKPQPWVRACVLFDEAWAEVHGVELGCGGHGQAHARGSKVYDWAARQSPGDWEGLVRETALAAARDPELSAKGVRSPFAVFAGSPGKWAPKPRRKRAEPDIVTRALELWDVVAPKAWSHAERVERFGFDPILELLRAGHEQWLTEHGWDPVAHPVPGWGLPADEEASSERAAASA